MAFAFRMASTRITRLAQTTAFAMEELGSSGGVGGGWAMKTGHQDGMALVPVVQPSYSAGLICILEKDKKAVRCPAFDY